MLEHLGLKILIATMLCVAAPLPAFATDKLNFDSLPTITNPAKGLPGVDLNAAAKRQETKDDCTESRYHSATRSGLAETGTVSECHYGNLSVRTYQKNNGIGRNNVFPTPEPLIDKGPPPGSGGYAPVERW